MVVYSYYIGCSIPQLISEVVQLFHGTIVTDEIVLLVAAVFIGSVTC